MGEFADAPMGYQALLCPILGNHCYQKKLTITTQALLSLLFLVLALSSDSRYFLVLSSVCFVGIAFVSSLHDIVSDGVYILNLKEEEQKRYVAIRSFFYQMGRLVIKGFLLTSIAQIALHYHFNVWQVFSIVCLC